MGHYLVSVVISDDAPLGFCGGTFAVGDRGGLGGRVRKVEEERGAARTSQGLVNWLETWGADKIFDSVRWTWTEN